MAIGYKTPGSGRKAGTPNRITTTFKEAVLNVFEKGGGEAWLLEWAKANPTDYFRVAARLIPQEASVNTNSDLDIGVALAKATDRVRRLHVEANQLPSAVNKPSLPSNAIKENT
ncbi:MAG: hypothetical protein M0Q15_14810 [Nevskia sp.]|jgi:hypothetical protein|nr:hypothetical protein [Nevskia sp.]